MTTTISTYPDAGRTIYSPGTSYTIGSPGNGSAARTTTTTYDPYFHAFSTSITNSLGHVETAGYDYRMGTLTSVTDANSQTTTASYDAFGRMITLIRPGDTTTLPTVQAFYLDNETPFRYVIAQLESATAGGLRQTQHYYDGMGRQIQTKQESSPTSTLQNSVTDTRYDGLGRATQQSQPRYVNAANDTAFAAYTPPSSDPNVMRWTTTTYDALGRASTITAPDGSVTAHRYSVVVDGANRFRYHDVTDAERHRTQQRFDSLGRLRKVDEISGNCGNYWGYSCAAPYTQVWEVAATTRYSYSPLDLLTTVVDQVGNTTTMGYDTLGRKTSMSDPDMGSWSYAYDANGNLTRQTDAKGQRICFYYDKLDRLTGKHQRTDNSCPATATNLYARYDYDQNSNGKGQRTYAETLSGATITSANVWNYDARGRVSQAHHYVAALGGAWRSFAWAYDSADRVTTQSYPAYGSQGAETVAYSYDSAWRQDQVCINGTNSCYAGTWFFTALNQPLQQGSGNGMIQTWEYNALGQLNQLRVGTTTTNGSMFNRSYFYDTVGNLTTMYNSYGETQTYGYDQRDRLTRWTLGSTTQNYTYDTIGNLTSKAGLSLSYGSTGSGSGAGPHQVRSVGGQSCSYDANGNQTSGPGRSVSWSAENMPTSATNAGVTESYTYNADGQRVTRTASGVTTVYFEGMWEEQTNGSAATRYYSLNSQTVAMRRMAGATATMTYLHGDHLGSMGISTANNGTLASVQEFDPWGKVIATAGTVATQRNYTGQYLDGTGFLFYNARYYDPNLGRFLSADTIVPGNPSGSMDGVAVRPLTVSFHEGGFLSKANSENRMGFWFQLDRQGRQQMGSPMGPANPQALNRYSYVQNNPLKYTDPTGHTIYLDPYNAGRLVSALSELADQWKDIVTLSGFLSSATAGISGIITALGLTGAVAMAFATIAAAAFVAIAALAATVGAAAIYYAAMDIQFLAYRIAEYTGRGSGIAIAAENGYIYLLNRDTGSEYVWDAPLWMDVSLPGWLRFDTTIGNRTGESGSYFYRSDGSILKGATIPPCAPNCP